LDNLRKHVENVRHFGRDPVVAINHFAADTDEELAVISKACADLGVAWALSDVFSDGGAGGADLARKVVEQASKVSEPYTPLYTLEMSAEEKVEALATKLYGADGVVWSDEAKRDLRRIAKLGYANLPVCVAKTHKSLSDDPKKANRPSGFTVQVRSLVLSAGAGFLVPLLGEVVRMPGLPKRPNFSDVELLDSGEITGLG
ncbi:MAG: formate--tetrahydrofolate ligase, partial [Acidobacteriota bacterium]